MVYERVDDGSILAQALLHVTGEVAVHLLTRLLAFDPARRCTADEALQHEFFAGLESIDDVEAGLSSSFPARCGHKNASTTGGFVFPSSEG